MKNAGARPCMKGWLADGGYSRSEVVGMGESRGEHVVGVKRQQIVYGPRW